MSQQMSFDSLLYGSGSPPPPPKAPPSLSVPPSAPRPEVSKRKSHGANSAPEKATASRQFPASVLVHEEEMPLEQPAIPDETLLPHQARAIERGPGHPPELTIDEQFAEFHAANPHVYDRLLELALDMRGEGEHIQRTYGMGGLFEVLRHEINFHVDRPQADRDDASKDFKLNNNFRALYARLLMRDNERLVGFFRTRRRHCRGAIDDGEDE